MRFPHLESALSAWVDMRPLQCLLIEQGARLGDEATERVGILQSFVAKPEPSSNMEEISALEKGIFVFPQKRNFLINEEYFNIIDIGCPKAGDG